MSVVRVLFLGLGLALLVPGDAPAAGRATVEPALERALARDGSDALHEAIVTVARRSHRTTAERIVRRGIAVIRYEHLPLLAVRGTPRELRGLRSLAGVRRLSFNRRLNYALGQSRSAIGADTVHDQLGVTGRGVGIAIVDTGVDGTHPDLRSAVAENVKVLASDEGIWSFAHPLGVERPDGIPTIGTFLVPGRQTDVSSGHGSHVAGIAAGRGVKANGRYRGIAPGAHLLSIAAGEATNIMWALAGLDHVLERRKALNIQVVNNSWGAKPQEPFATYDPNDPVSVATRALHDAGVAVVFAAGNDGPETGTMNVYGIWPWVFAVANGCVHGKPRGFARCTPNPPPAGYFALADSSSRGVEGDDLNHPDLVAPGTAIVSAKTSTPTESWTYPDVDLPGECGSRGVADFLRYTCKGGTSMAAPHVSGTMALMEEAAERDLTPQELYSALMRTASPIPGLEEFQVGAGFMDAAAAVNEVRPAPAVAGQKKEKQRPTR